MGLIVLAASSGIVGIWALIDLAGIFESFPGGGMGWVRLLPPYNEHLIRDVGALSLGNATLLAAAALILRRQLLLAAVGSWLVSAVPHALFHVTHRDGFAPSDAVGQTFGQIVLIVIALVLLRGRLGRGTARQRRTDLTRGTQ